jgi:DNA-binding PadR family transcriptional regulator
MKSPSDEENTGKKIIKGYSPKDIETRVVKSFLDIIILIEMKKQSNLSGYDVTAFVNSKFGSVLSPGTVYAELYSMERKGLLHSESDGRKTVYKLTPEGKQVISTMMSDFNEQMGMFVRKFLTIYDSEDSETLKK